MLRVTSRAAKIGVLALEIVGVLIAIVAGVAAFLFWRLQAGPLTLALFADSAEFAIERSLPPDHTVDIGGTVLSRRGGDGVYNLTLTSVEISDQSHAPLASLPRISLDFSPGDLLRGAFGPRRILIERPAIRIIRDADRAFKLDSAPTRGDRNLFELLTGGRYFRGAFQSAELQHAEIRFVDAGSGRSWVATDAGATVTRTPSGYSAEINGAFDIAGYPASLALDARYAESSGIVTARVVVDEAPVGDLLEIFYGPKAAILSAPVSGSATVTLTSAGEVIASAIKGHVGAGDLLIDGRRDRVEAIDVDAAFDPLNNAFDVNQLTFALAGSRGALSGEVRLQRADADASPSGIAVALKGEDITIDTKGFLPEPLVVSSFDVDGSYDFAARKVSLSSIQATLLGVTLAGSLDYARSPIESETQGRSPEIRAALKVDGAIEAQQILLGWPVQLGQGARDFVATRLPQAVAENMELRVDLPAGALHPDEPMPDDALALTFDIRDATAIYALGMTPLVGASGNAWLSGNRFLIQPAQGRIGDVDIRDGVIDFTALFPKGEPVKFDFTAQGKSRDILGVLNEEPLSILKSTNLEPARFAGDAVVRAEITRPNRREVPREKYGYSGTATFEDISISEFFRGIDLAAIKGGVKLENKSMTLTADAEFGNAPIQIVWEQRFYATEARSSFHVAGTVNSSTGDVFGVPTRQMLRGDVEFTVDATGDLGALESLKAHADFTKAALTIEAFGWAKPPEAPASGDIDLLFRDDGFQVQSLSFKGKEEVKSGSGAGGTESISILDVSGTASIGRGGVIESATFPKIYMKDSADFAFVAERSEAGPLDITLTGEYLNAGPLVESAVEAGPRNRDERPINWGDGVILRGRIDAMRLRGETTYADATLDFRHGGQRMQALSFSARTQEGKPVSVFLTETGAESGPIQLVEARTDDIGSLLAGVFGVTSIRGGEGSMEINVDRPNGAARGLNGVLEARGMRVFGAPLLARIFAAGSLNGLTDLLGGEGIALNRGYARFGFQRGVLTLDEARASGPSVGITSSGRIETGAGGAVTLSGAVAPAYQVNSLLGRAPLIGDIFVNREGEGVVALSYNVSGEAEAPTVTVNPLSALAPGFLRRMFEIERAPAPADGAEPPAGD